MNYLCKGKRVKLETKYEYDTMEDQQKDGKCKQVVDHPMKHVTRDFKSLIIKSKTLPKSSLKNDYSIDLENNPFEAEIKSKFDCFLETELEDYQGIKMLGNVEAGEIDGSSYYKDYKNDFKV